MNTSTEQTQTSIHTQTGIWTQDTLVQQTLCGSRHNTTLTFRSLLPSGYFLHDQFKYPKHFILLTATFISFGWFSGQITIISLNIFNLRVFTTLAKKIYRAVRSEPLNEIQVRRTLLKLLYIFDGNNGLCQWMRWPKVCAYSVPLLEIWVRALSKNA